MLALLFVGPPDPGTTACGALGAPDCDNAVCGLGFTKSASSCSWICSTVLTRCVRCAISSFVICDGGA